MINLALLIACIALILKLYIPKLFPYGPSQINQNVHEYRPKLVDVDPTIQTLHRDNTLKIYERMQDGKDPILIGPETVVIDDESNIYALAGDNIVQLSNLSDEQVNDKNERVVYANTEIVAKVTGQVLGGKFVPHTKTLYFADGVNGLCRIDLSKPHPKVEIVASSFQLEDGTWSKIAFADDLDIGPKSGKVYFSDASDISPKRDDGQVNVMEAYKADYLRSKKSGRLLQYDPSTNKITILASNIWFANGVAVNANESFLMVSESSMMRILKYHLTGPKKGQIEIMMNNIPGPPDGADCTNTYCYAPLPSSVVPISKLFERISPRAEAWIKTVTMILPKWMQPKPVPYGGVLEITYGDEGESSKINRLFQEPNGEHVSMITGVTEHNGKLYLGSLHNNYVGVLDLSIPID